MSGQDIGFFDVDANAPDIVIENGTMKADNTLETAVLISLFTDQLVSVEELPDGEPSRRGWWADEFSGFSDDKIGSLLWTVERAKTTQETANAIKGFAIDALQWLISDGLASAVAATATIVSNDHIDWNVTIFKPDGDDIPFKFIWDAQALRRA